MIMPMIMRTGLALPSPAPHYAPPHIHDINM